jgi:hypothetical protein
VLAHFDGILAFLRALGECVLSANRSGGAGRKGRRGAMGGKAKAPTKVDRLALRHAAACASAPALVT